MTALDLRENISALTIAILNPKIYTVEDAFAILSDGINFKKGKTHEQKRKIANEWILLKENGVTVTEISKMFGVPTSNVRHAIKRQKERKEVQQ